MEEDAQSPVAKRVAEEEEVAAAELGDERHGHEARHVSLGQIVDVIVLGYRKALPPAIGLAIDLTEEPQDDGSFVERDTCVGVRYLDDRRLLARQVEKAPLVSPTSDV